MIYVQFGFVNILDILTTIFNRISKQRKTSFEQSLVRKIHLLRSLFLDLFEMSIYNYCVRLKFPSYEVSPLDSFRCVEYVRKNRLGCDVLGVLSKQLLAISVQHLRTEAELEEAEEMLFVFGNKRKCDVKN